MVDQPADGAQPQEPRGTPGADDSKSGDAGGDTPIKADSDPGDTGGGDDQKVPRAKFEDVRRDRDALLQKVRDLDTWKAEVARALGVTPAQDPEDPTVVNEQLSAENAQLKRSLAFERVLGGVADKAKGKVVLAGLESTGAVDLSTTDDPSTIEAITTLLRTDYGHLFASAAGTPKVPVTAPTPKNGAKPTIKYNPGVMRADGRSIL